LDKDLTLKKGKRLHASYDNNLPGLISNDLLNYIQNLKNEGLLLKRLPSVDLDPPDLQKQ